MNNFCDQCGKIIPETNQHKAFGMTLCGKHYSQLIKYGKFLDNNPKSTFDSNEYEITEDGVWIYCNNKAQEPAGKFLIDLDDLELVLAKKWRFWKGQYFTGNTKPIQISTFLTQPKEGYVVDHINGNRQDNRRCNLRIVTQNKNLLNKAINSNNSSGFSGVSWDKNRNKWAVEIRMDGVRIRLGRFDKIEDAVTIRYYSELILFKEFRSNRNDDKILQIVEQCERKDELMQIAQKKISEKISYS